MGKLEYVHGYIDKCNMVIKSNNIKEAELLQDEIIGIFENEIKEIRNMLSAYSPLAFDEKNVDYIKDIELLKQKLTNYYYNMEDAKEKRDYELELAKLKQPQVSAYAESNPIQSSILKANLTVNLEQTIEKLNNLSEDELSTKEKEELKKRIVSLEDSRSKGDKNKSWEIIKEILKFIADKGVDVAIASLPFIASKIS
ncbi:hypothetical protein ACWG0P_10975 [Amedibacillus sp. YH-ame6]